MKKNCFWRGILSDRKYARLIQKLFPFLPKHNKKNIKKIFQKDN